MDLFKRASQHKFGPGGLNCPCCDNGYCKKRKRGRLRLSLSKLRRSLLKRMTKQEIDQSM